MKFFAPLVFLLVLALILALDVLLDARSRINYAVEPFSIPALNGSATLSPASWKGKIVMLNVFATWCGPCNMEMPVLMKLAALHKIDIVGIAWKDSPENIAEFLAARGNPYRAVGVDSQGVTTLKLGLTGVPETFILDRNGIVRYHYPGALSTEMIDTDIIPFIEKLEHAPQ